MSVSNQDIENEFGELIGMLHSKIYEDLNEHLIQAIYDEAVPSSYGVGVIQGKTCYTRISLSLYPRDRSLLAVMTELNKLKEKVITILQNSE